jgi:hypothetical protein
MCIMNKINFFKFCLLFSLILSPIQATSEDKTAKDFLAEALVAEKSIRSEMSIKEKISTYENVLSIISKIIKDYTSSDIGIKLLSDQTVGTFDPAKIRSVYSDLLFKYYDTVCETSPSYQCLGFVSLKNGIEGCLKSGSFNELRTAHKNLLTSVKIFKGQGSDPHYIDLSLASYRNCKKEVKGANATWTRDYFSADLARLLLELDAASRARGLIEQMKDPYFKLSSVLLLKDYSKETLDQTYVGRLQKYIDKKFKASTVESWLSRVKLMDLVARKGEGKFGYADVRYPGGMIEVAFSVDQTTEEKCKTPACARKQRSRQAASCNRPLVDYAYDTWTDFQVTVKSQPRDRLGDSLSRLSGGFKTLRVKPLLNLCKDSQGRYDYDLMQSMHRDLLFKFGLDSAKTFKKMTLTSSLNVEELWEHYIDLTIKSKDDLKGLGYTGAGQTWPAYKKFVDFSDVCKASEILFKQLKGTKNYEKAIAYMVNSPSISPSEKYSCGDEDLELLLM